MSMNALAIPNFTEEKRLDGRKNWPAFKQEVLLQVRAKGLLGYLHNDIQRPMPRPSTSPVIVVTDTDTQSAPENALGQQQPVITPLWSMKPSPEEWDARDRYVASGIILNTLDPVGVGIDEHRDAWFILVLCGLGLRP
ncbi:hypothetical protein E1B28_012699 [Marasmius oreades]|uniref:Uncharacterized protein n=1 Tax=Marasmius oreades TaxID=181124 RepID=A0A9P7RT38_9AGAR|nr:uncharacterized protein E1B28_012699 [Marasmius oreades]KAG7088731.1 hypothetical protein E1B28_012699 [Marasmius oreades]